MKRPPQYLDIRWDDPFWHVVRLVVDEIPRRRNKPPILTETQILPALEKAGSEVTAGLGRYLTARMELVPKIAAYLEFRHEAAIQLLLKARSEDEALIDFANLSKEIVARYGTRSKDHHQSSKVMVQTVDILTRKVCLDRGFTANLSPQKRATLIGEQHIWVSPRRLDGALPSLVNPVGLWEIKEYWGGTAGGSKMSDVIYECQLVGTELRAFADLHGASAKHYAVMDGANQWHSRVSDLRRAIDLLCSGILDELVVGSEVLSDWPRIVNELCDLALEIPQQATRSGAAANAPRLW